MWKVQLLKSSSDMMAIRVWLAIVILGWPSAATANLDFTRTQHDNTLTLTYQFNDPDNVPVQLQSHFPADAFIHTPVHFRPLSTHRLQRDVRQRLLQKAREQGWNNIRIQQTSLGLRIEALNGPATERDKRVQFLQARQRQIEDDVLADAYYTRLREHTGREGYIPDHVRLAYESQPMLTPLAQSWQAHLGDASPREALHQLTHWLQQVSYADLENRLDSPGSGFATPTRLLYENRGDCDSKVTLLGALFSLLYPDVSSRIVYLPGHAIFAADVEREEEDIWLRDGDYQLVIADPTGPASLPPGQAAARYEPNLRSGAVVMREF